MYSLMHTCMCIDDHLSGLGSTSRGPSQLVRLEDPWAINITCGLKRVCLGSNHSNYMGVPHLV